MIESVQAASSAHAASQAPATVGQFATLAKTAGSDRTLPSVIVSLGTTAQTPLTYNAAGYLGTQGQVPVPASASPATVVAATPTPVNPTPTVAPATPATPTPVDTAATTVATAPTGTATIPTQNTAAAGTPAMTTDTALAQTAANAADLATFALNNIELNPSYAGMAATIFLNAMIQRPQQGPAGTAGNPAVGSQPLAAIGGSTPSYLDRNGPADDRRNGIL